MGSPFVLPKMWGMGTHELDVRGHFFMDGDADRQTGMLGGRLAGRQAGSLTRMQVGLW